MRFHATLFAVAALLSVGPAVAQKGKMPIEIPWSRSTARLTFVSTVRNSSPKNQASFYTKFTNHRIAITGLPTLLGAVDFSGGKDIQPVPGNYLLTVDKLVLSGGTVVPSR